MLVFLSPACESPLNGINEMLQDCDPLRLPEATSEPSGGKLLQGPWLPCRGVSFLLPRRKENALSRRMSNII